MNKSIPSKSITIVLSALLFATNVVLPHSLEANIWKERSAQLIQPKISPPQNQVMPIFSRLPAAHQGVLSALPYHLGSVRKIIKAKDPSSPIVIYIQDVHMNNEAQNNISRAVQSLIDKEKIDLVALEGSFGAMDFSAIRNYFHKPSIDAVADYLFRIKEISGPVLTAWTSRTDIPDFVGVDHKEFYQNNVQAYLDSKPRQNILLNQIQKEKQKIKSLKRHVLNKELNAFDQQAEAYKDKSLTMVEYISVLRGLAQETSWQMDLFEEASQLETQIDFDRVEHERSFLIKELANKLDQGKIDYLMHLSTVFRTGSIKQADFYSYLKKLCGQHKVPLVRYPEMQRYLQYILLSDQIDADELLSDIQSYQIKAYEKLVQSQEERELIEDALRIDLTEKLVKFELVPSEWEEYHRHSREGGNPRYRRPGGSSPRGGAGQDLDRSRSRPWTETFQGDAVASSGSSVRHRTDPPRRTSAEDDGLASFEQFYISAENRDQAIATNLLTQIKTRNAKTAVLVTGGFHSPGITSKLKDKATLIVFTPKLTQIEKQDHEGSSYLSVFSQEKTPLDKLVNGEKLFTAPNPRANQLLSLSLFASLFPQIKKPKPSLDVALKELNSEKMDIEVKNNGSLVRIGNKTLGFTETETERRGMRIRRHQINRVVPTNKMSIFSGSEWYEKYIAPAWESVALGVLVTGPVIPVFIYLAPFVAELNALLGLAVLGLMAHLYWGLILAVIMWERLHKQLNRDIGDAAKIAHLTGFLFSITTTLVSLMITPQFNLESQSMAAIVLLALILGYALGHGIVHYFHNINKPSHQRMILATEMDFSGHKEFSQSYQQFLVTMAQMNQNQRVSSFEPSISKDLIAEFIKSIKEKYPHFTFDYDPKGDSRMVMEFNYELYIAVNQQIFIPFGLYFEADFGPLMVEVDKVEEEVKGTRLTGLFINNIISGRRNKRPFLSYSLPTFYVLNPNAIYDQARKLFRSIYQTHGSLKLKSIRKLVGIAQKYKPEGLDLYLQAKLTAIQLLERQESLIKTLMFKAGLGVREQPSLRLNESGILFALLEQGDLVKAQGLVFSIHREMTRISHDAFAFDSLIADLERLSRTRKDDIGPEKLNARVRIALLFSKLLNRRGHVINFFLKPPETEIILKYLDHDKRNPHLIIQEAYQQLLEENYISNDEYIQRLQSKKSQDGPDSMSIFNGDEFYETRLAPAWESFGLAALTTAIIGFFIIKLTSLEHGFVAYVLFYVGLLIIGTLINVPFFKWLHKIGSGKDPQEGPAVAHLIGLLFSPVMAWTLTTVTTFFIPGIPFPTRQLIILAYGGLGYFIGHVLIHYAHNATHESDERMSLFSGNHNVDELINEIHKNWDTIKEKGAFVFDLDNTLTLPQVSLVEFPEVADLLAKLLKEGVRVVINTGAPGEEALNRIHSILIEKLGPDLPALKNLTVFASRGGEKIDFEETGTYQLDPAYTELTKIDPGVVDLIAAAVAEQARDKFGLSDEQIKEWERDANDKTEYNKETIDLSWKEGNENWRPSVLTWNQVRAPGDHISYPYLQVSRRLNGDIIGLSIKPTPIIDEGGKEIDIRGALQEKIIQTLSRNGFQLNIGSSGKATTEMTKAGIDKAFAIKYFMEQNELNPKRVFYIGDEFFQREIVDAKGVPHILNGNDEVVARDPELKTRGIRTLSVGKDKPVNSQVDMHIGQGILATQEFLQAILSTQDNSGKKNGSSLSLELNSLKNDFIITNSPKPHPDLSLSVVAPVLGEFKNGNAIRLMESLLNQDVDSKYLELILVVNNQPDQRDEYFEDNQEFLELARYIQSNGKVAPPPAYDLLDKKQRKVVDRVQAGELRVTFIDKSTDGIPKIIGAIRNHGMRVAMEHMETVGRNGFVMGMDADTTLPQHFAGRILSFIEDENIKGIYLDIDFAYRGGREELFKSTFDESLGHHYIYYQSSMDYPNPFVASTKQIILRRDTWKQIGLVPEVDHVDDISITKALKEDPGIIELHDVASVAQDRERKSGYDGASRMRRLEQDTRMWDREMLVEPPLRYRLFRLDLLTLRLKRYISAQDKEDWDYTVVRELFQQFQIPFHYPDWHEMSQKEDFPKGVSTDLNWYCFKHRIESKEFIGPNTKDFRNNVLAKWSEAEATYLDQMIERAIYLEKVQIRMFVKVMKRVLNTTYLKPQQQHREIIEKVLGRSKLEVIKYLRNEEWFVDHLVEAARKPFDEGIQYLTEEFPDWMRRLEDTPHRNQVVHMRATNKFMMIARHRPDILPVTHQKLKEMTGHDFTTFTDKPIHPLTMFPTSLTYTRYWAWIESVIYISLPVFFLTAFGRYDLVYWFAEGLVALDLEVWLLGVGFGGLVYNVLLVYLHPIWDFFTRIFFRVKTINRDTGRMLLGIINIHLASAVVMYGIYFILDPSYSSSYLLPLAYTGMHAFGHFIHNRLHPLKASLSFSNLHWEEDVRGAIYVPFAGFNYRLISELIKRFPQLSKIIFGDLVQHYGYLSPTRMRSLPDFFRGIGRRKIRVVPHTKDANQFNLLTDDGNLVDLELMAFSQSTQVRRNRLGQNSLSYIFIHEDLFKKLVQVNPFVLSHLIDLVDINGFIEIEIGFGYEQTIGFFGVAGPYLGIEFAATPKKKRIVLIKKRSIHREILLRRLQHLNSIEVYKKQLTRLETMLKEDVYTAAKSLWKDLRNESEKFLHDNERALRHLPRDLYRTYWLHFARVIQLTVGKWPELVPDNIKQWIQKEPFNRFADRQKIEETTLINLKQSRENNIKRLKEADSYYEELFINLMKRIFNQIADQKWNPEVIRATFQTYHKTIVKLQEKMRLVHGSINLLETPDHAVDPFSDSRKSYVNLYRHPAPGCHLCLVTSSHIYSGYNKSRFKDAKVEVQIRPYDGRNLSNVHHYIEIKMKGYDEPWALDLTGSQYAVFGDVEFMPYSEYVNRMKQIQPMLENPFLEEEFDQRKNLIDELLPDTSDGSVVNQPLALMGLLGPLFEKLAFWSQVNRKFRWVLFVFVGGAGFLEEFIIRQGIDTFLLNGVSPLYQIIIYGLIFSIIFHPAIFYGNKGERKEDVVSYIYDVLTEIFRKAKRWPVFIYDHIISPERVQLFVLSLILGLIASTGLPVILTHFELIEAAGYFDEKLHRYWLVGTLHLVFNVFQLAEGGFLAVMNIRNKKEDLSLSGQIGNRDLGMMVDEHDAPFVRRVLDSLPSRKIILFGDQTGQDIYKDTRIDYRVLSPTDNPVQRLNGEKIIDMSRVGYVLSGLSVEERVNLAIAYKKNTVFTNSGNLTIFSKIFDEVKMTTIEDVLDGVIRSTVLTFQNIQSRIRKSALIAFQA